MKYTLGYCNINTYEDEEVAFIWQRMGEQLKWRHIRRNIEGHNIEDKIHCTASKLAENWLKSSLAIYHIYKSSTTGCYLRDLAILSKQDGKIWLKSCFRGE